MRISAAEICRGPAFRQLRPASIAVLKRRPASLLGDPPSGWPIAGSRLLSTRAGESDPGAESGLRPDKCHRFSLALNTIEQAKPTPARGASSEAVFKRRPASLSEDLPSEGRDADFCPGGALRGEAVRVGRSERAAVLVCFRRGREGESDPGSESGSRRFWTADLSQKIKLFACGCSPSSRAPRLGRARRSRARLRFACLALPGSAPAPRRSSSSRRCAQRKL